jgi:glucosyl-dolichyl phosphate glucuronosyltransferase
LSVDVSVVICAHDPARWSQLHAALASLNRQRHRPAETVLVIDHDRRLFERARAQWPGVTVVENVGCRGLGGARNSGICASSGSVVAFLDDDAIASPEWLSVFVEHYSDPDVAGVGGSIEPAWEHARPAWFPAEFDWVVGCTYRGVPDAAHDVRNLLGCNMSFRRDLLDALGRFRLGYGCDETELCIRLRQRWPQKRLVYAPDAKVLHRIPASRARLRYFLTRCYFEGGSKAVVCKLVGAQDGLASERRYTRQTLPDGVRRALGDFLQRGDPDGIARAATIVVGLTTTTLGFCAGRLSVWRAAKRRGWSGQARTAQVIP